MLKNFLNVPYFWLTDYIGGGDLSSYISEGCSLEKDTVRIYCAEIIVALEHLHKLNIIYRDLKQQNVLIDIDGHVVLTDFGLSKITLNGRAYSIVGTPQYMAPEMLNNNQNGYDESIDRWSLGILCCEMLTGTSPYTKKDEPNSQNEIFSRIKQLETPPIPTTIRSSARSLLKKLLTKNPTLRLGK